MSSAPRPEIRPEGVPSGSVKYICKKCQWAEGESLCATCSKQSASCPACTAYVERSLDRWVEELRATDDVSLAAPLGLPKKRPVSATGRSQQEWPAEVEPCRDLQSIVNEALDETKADGAAIALREGGVVICKASAGFAPEIGTVLDTSAGITAECLATGRTLRCDDAATDPRVNSDVCQELGISSILVVPVNASERTLGLIEVLAPSSHHFTPEHESKLQHLAALVSASHAPLEVEQAPATGPRTADELLIDERLKELTSPEALTAMFAMVDEPATAPAAEKTPAVIKIVAEPKRASLPKVARAAELKTKAEGIARKVAIEAAIIIVLVAAVFLLVRWALTPKPSAQPSAPAVSEPASQPAVETPSLPEAGTPKASLPQTQSKPAAERKPQATSAEEASDDRPSPASSVPAVPIKLESGAARQTAAFAAPNLGSVGASQAPVNLAPASADSITLAAQRRSEISGPIKLDIVRQSMPVYPQQARTGRVEGDVVLKGVVGKNGKFHSLQKVSGHPFLTQAAIDAVNKWEYKPYSPGGVPSELEMQVVVRFRLP